MFETGEKPRDAEDSEVGVVGVGRGGRERGYRHGLLFLFRDSDVDLFLISC